MHARSWKKIVALSVLLFAVIASAQQTLGPVIVTAPPPPPTLPTVTATAPRIGGGPTIICRGSACAAFLDGLKAQYNPENFDSEGMLGDEAPVPGPQFCSGLKQLKPAGCNLASPPPSPGIPVTGQASYQPNGCGTGRLVNAFADVFLEITSRPTYSGDFQSPFPGANFRSACNGHDTCWASANPKGNCDYAFRQDMIAACGGDSPANNNCLGFAGLYHHAVSNTGPGYSAYASSTGDRTCAVWAMDMRANGCQ